MTIRELIERLQQESDPDMLVYTHGYEYGYEDLNQVLVAPVKRNHHWNPSCGGPHEICIPDDCAQEIDESEMKTLPLGLLLS